jgi:hypothetical protein
MTLASAALVAVVGLVWSQRPARSPLGPAGFVAVTRRGLGHVVAGPSTRTTVALAVGAGMIFAAPGAARLVEGIAWLAAHTGLDAARWAPAVGDTVWAGAIAAAVADVAVIGLWRSEQPVRWPPRLVARLTARWTVPALRHILIGLALPTIWVAGLPLAVQTSSDAIEAVGGAPEPAACAPADLSSTSVAGYGPNRLANAKLIVDTGKAMHVPERGQWIALATAMQESSLRNIDYGDRDSLGLFQQRPSQDWGTPTQVLDPVYAATQFYSRLVKIRGWESLPLWQAAQAVQRSGHPTAYDTRKDAAAAVLGAVNATTCPEEKT